MKLTPLSLRDIENDEGKTVFVLNTTKGKYRGQVVIAVPRPNGIGLDGVIIPPTFIPIELTEQVSKKQLLDSSDFRKSISRGLIIPVSTKDALSFLETDDAKEEIENLYASQQLQRDAMISTHVDDIEIPELQNMEKGAEGTGLDVDEDGRVDGVSLAVMQSVEILKESGNEKACISSFRSQVSMTPEDYRYVMNNISKTEYSSLFDFCRSQYNLLKDK